jgi:hypothetical protein
MFEIILLIVVTGGIASFARAPGGRPWLWGTLTRRVVKPRPLGWGYETR